MKRIWEYLNKGNCMSSNSRLLKNSGIYAIVQILQKCIGFILIPVYMTVLPSTENGIVSTITAVVSFLGIVYTLSLNSAVVRFYIDYKDDEIKLKEFWGTCITFIMLNSIILSVVFFIVRDVLLVPILGGISFFPYMAIGMISIALNPIYTVFQSTLQAKEQSRAYGANNLAYFIINLSLTILFVVVFRLGALGIISALAITDTIFFMYTLYKFVPTIKILIKKYYLKKALKYSLPLLPHSLSGWAMAMIDKLFLNNKVGTDVAGVYGLGSQFANIINVLASAVNQAYVPWFFEGMKDKERNQTEIVKMSEVITIFYGVLAMGMSLFGPEAIKILPKNGYDEAWKAIPLLSFAFVFNGIYYFFVNPLFYNKNGVKYIAIGTFTSAVLNSVLNIYFIPKYGIVGAGLASMISMMAACILIYYISEKIEPIGFNIMKLFTITFFFLGLGLLSFVLEGNSFVYNIIIKSLIVIGVFVLIFLKYKKEILNITKNVRKSN